MSQPILHRISGSLRWLLPLVMLAVAAAVFMLLTTSKPQAPSKPAEEKVWSIQTVTADPRQHQPVLELYGQVETPRLTTLTAAINAYVETVETDAGRSAASGTRLLQLDTRDATLVLQQRAAAVIQAQAQLDAEQVRYAAEQRSLKIQQNLLQLSARSVKRYEDLEKRKVSSVDQLDTARSAYQQQALALASLEESIADHPNRIKQLQAQLDSAVALRDAAQLDLERTRITAPYDARIVSVSVAPGDRVKTGDQLITLYNQNRLEVRAQLPNRILSILRQAGTDQAIVAQASLDGQTLDLELDRFAATVNTGQAGIDSFFRFSDSTLPLEAGRSLSMYVVLPPVDSSIALPATALYGLDRVYKVVDQRLQGVSIIRLGDTRMPNGELYILVRSTDIQPGDQILTTQLPNAISGLKVKEISNDG
ncbi:efflux RND transporter periplasmic adaptor subunit [Pontibacter sp. JAM-7]|uniref:efflux RND transporter periplasmic adaptor subunit n=1 Tax=Pontibacter sp. JAM-7 TaxID=3366581 RepID=UPI003AF91F6B